MELIQRSGQRVADYQFKGFVSPRPRAELEQLSTAFPQRWHVQEDPILVTYDNAPNAERLRQHYEGTPKKLEAEGVDPRRPWRYNFKLDFRFK